MNLVKFENCLYNGISQFQNKDKTKEFIKYNFVYQDKIISMFKPYDDLLIDKLSDCVEGQRYDLEYKPFVDKNGNPSLRLSDIVFR